MRALILLCLVLPLTGCALDAKDAKPLGVLSQPERVSSLAFQLAPENFGQDLAPANRQEMSQSISQNLASLDYPVKTSAERADKPAYTLEGRIGVASQKATPAGFTLEFGNSDPRALNFQKAEVLPISCALHTQNQAESAMTLSGEFALPSEFSELVGGKQPAVPPAFYVDRITTVCLNLLTELKIPKNKAAQPGAGIPWAPSLNIEIRNSPKENTVDKAAPMPASAAVATPEKTEKAGLQTLPAASPAENKEEEGRKQLIIHNLGTPVILEFGYERR